MHPNLGTRQGQRRLKEWQCMLSDCGTKLVEVEEGLKQFELGFETLIEPMVALPNNVAKLATELTLRSCAISPGASATSRGVTFATSASSNGISTRFWI